MSLSIFAIFLGFFLLSPLTVTCSRHHHENRRNQSLPQSNTKLAAVNPEGPDSQGAKEFSQWIARVGKKHRLKQQARARSGELVGELDPALQPDLSGSFPGLKQYYDWGSVVSPGTYIVVDQSGFGNFRAVWEAIQ